MDRLDNYSVNTKNPTEIQDMMQYGHNIGQKRKFLRKFYKYINVIYAYVFVILFL